MRNFNHPYSRYGLALVMQENELDSPEKVTIEMLIKQLEWALEHFRLKPVATEKDEVKFEFISYNDLLTNSSLVQSSGLAAKGYFLAPNIITRERSAKQLFQAQTNLIEDLKSGVILSKQINITMSMTPVTSKINQGKTSQSPPKSDYAEAACCAITNTTRLKPSLAVNGMPTCIIPDLPLFEMKSFIGLFRKMNTQRTEKGLLTSKTFREQNEGEESQKIRRPKIFNGNYPNAPTNWAFGAPGLLGAIGEWAKEAEMVNWANEVLESLKNAPLYLVNYEKTELKSYSDYVVELAKNHQLNQIIKAIDQTLLYKDSNRYYGNPNYQTFYLMAGRFLQLYNAPAFQNFLSFRGSYDSDLVKLLNSYFMDNQKINPALVKSAKALGSWLNYTAYLAALKEMEHRNQKDQDSLYKAKAKFLTELESSALSAKSGSRLLAQIVTRAGRLTGRDAPAEASQFMEAVTTGEIDLKTAKDLMIAFSRLRNQREKSAENSGEGQSEDANPYESDPEINET